MRWERDIYIVLLQQYIEDQNLKRHKEESESTDMDEEELGALAKKLRL